jgi:hypothetical protein
MIELCTWRQVFDKTEPVSFTPVFDFLSASDLVFVKIAMDNRVVK